MKNKYSIKVYIFIFLLHFWSSIDLLNILITNVQFILTTTFLPIKCNNFTFPGILEKLLNLTFPKLTSLLRFDKTRSATMSMVTFIRTVCRALAFPDGPRTSPITVSLMNRVVVVLLYLNDAMLGFFTDTSAVSDTLDPGFGMTLLINSSFVIETLFIWIMGSLIWNRVNIKMMMITIVGIMRRATMKLQHFMNLFRWILFRCNLVSPLSLLKRLRVAGVRGWAWSLSTMVMEQWRKTLRLWEILSTAYWVLFIRRWFREVPKIWSHWTMLN